MDMVRADRKRLENPYAHVEYLDESIEVGRFPFRLAREDLISGLQHNSSFRRSSVESAVRRLHREIWLNRDEIWPDRRNLGFREMLDPSIALSSLGYSMEVVDSLGQYTDMGDTFEVAGVFDSADSRVLLSARFPPDLRRFTAAHELGHAVLHARTGMHRERPVDRTRARGREVAESEADWFATFYLMPAKAVQTEFEKRFLAGSFTLTEATAFALMAPSADEVRRACATPRAFALKLASAGQYNGAHFYSLADCFGVSVKAMAIRIEELDLIDLASL
jgi:Zn-dependent peptidase ImmA (M78 family)